MYSHTQKRAAWTSFSTSDISTRSSSINLACWCCLCIHSSGCSEKTAVGCQWCFNDSLDFFISFFCAHIKRPGRWSSIRHGHWQLLIFKTICSEERHGTCREMDTDETRVIEVNVWLGLDDCCLTRPDKLSDFTPCLMTKPDDVRGNDLFV